MPEIYNNKFSLAFDIYGCPNRCKHCWIGYPKHSNMNPNEVIDVFLRIKEEQNTFLHYNSELEYIDASFREPHYGNDYKDLYKRIDYINGCSLEVDKNFELISLWRLNHDESYLPWIKARGIKRVQLKVFGMEETNDFFYGREGAHNELISGTNNLVDNGIIPRWQVYPNKMGIDELYDVIQLAHSLDLFNKVRRLGEEFNLKGNPYDPSGAGFNYHHLRIDKADISRCPVDMIDINRLRTESEMVKYLLINGEVTALPRNHNLWFYVTADWNVYPNFSEIAPWWKLGNLKKNKWHEILSRYVNNDNLGLKVMTEISLKELAIKCGNPDGDKVFTNDSQYGEYLLGKYCRIKYYM